MPRSKPEQFSDEYFIKLTMDYDERDDNIYPKWALWCANSEDRYYIDGKDHHFYTHKRTDKEIEIERKKRQILEMSFSQDREGIDEEEWMEYEQYLHERTMDNEVVLNFNPPTFEEWKNNK